MKKPLLLAILALWTLPAQGQVNVLTHRYDNLRSNQNLSESTLTASNVNSGTFGKVYTFAVDGYVYAQPLYMSNLAIPGKGTHNVVFVATEHDSVYAFDADTATPLWQTSFINPAAGVTPVPVADMLTSDLIPDTEVGVMSTPVIDATSGTIYVVASTKENGNHVYRVHALDVTTGIDKVSPVVIQASVLGNGAGSIGGTLTFNPAWQLQRPGLALANGAIYVGFGSSSDNWSWHGWLIGYNSTTLAQVAVYCATPNGIGGGIWAAGEAPPIDPSGNLYFSTGNGDFDGSTNFGESYVHLGTSSGLTVLDYFSPFNQAPIEAAELDIATAGLTLLPASAGTAEHPHIVVGSGKDGTIYVLDRDNMGKFNGSYTNPDSQIIQEIWNALGIIAINAKAATLPYVENNYSTPAFWQNHLYWTGINDKVKMFNLSNGLLTATAVSASSTAYAFGGSEPVISANGSGATSAILWTVERASTNVLHAYNATNLASELYNSNQAAGNRDLMGPSVKFVVPTVANGKVFVGSQTQIDVFGILASTPAQTAAPTFIPFGGNYINPQTVTISDADPGATIYYTLDGSIPTTSSAQYVGPFLVNSTTTVSAIAVVSGFLTSPVATVTYKIGGTLVTTGGFVQGNYSDPQSPQTSVAVNFTAPQTGGDLNVIVVGWNDTTATVTSVTDSVGNTYALAVGPTVQLGVTSQSIYYAYNIVPAAAGANTVTVRFNVAATFPDIRILEYSGLDTNNPLDVTAGAQGNSSFTNSGSATTTSATELIVGANMTQTQTTSPGAGFTSRMITAPDGDMVEDMVVTSAGTYSATASILPAGQWVMQMATFRAAPTLPTPTAPSNLTATAASSAEIDLVWNIATETGGTISQYLIERCANAGCSNFVQVGTAITATFSDTVGLVPLTTYNYRIRAIDTANTTGPYSNTATATTLSLNAPTAPTNLAAAALSSVQVSLTWTASTPTSGTISNYFIERCLGNRCTMGYVQVGTSATTAFTDTGLLASTTYTYRVRAIDSSSNYSPYSSFATVTTTAPTLTAPSNLTATAASNTQINLGWTASTETGGTISQYLIERCTGATCINFVQVGTSIGTAFSDTGLTASTSYSYRVRATDGTNFSPYSNTAGATTSSGAPPPPTISFIQANYSDPQSPQSIVTVSYAAAQKATDLNVVVIGWNDSTSTVSSVTDTVGNVYTQALVPTVQTGTATQVIYYAKNIPAAAANANKVTVKFNGSAAFPDIRILEYSGLDPNNPLDVTAAATGTSTSSSSGAVTTLNANNLIIGANLVQSGTTGAGTGFTSRIISSPDNDIVEDRVVTAVGSYTATAPVSPSANWIMQLVAFKAAGSAPVPTAPGTLTAAASGPVQINLSWTASTETGGTIGSYLVERCTGATCSNFAQIGTSTTAVYGDTGLLGSTAYNYRVRAMDTNNNTGPYSNTATATTAAPTFIAPSSLTATASGPVQVNLSWTAGSETGGTISNYLIERCSGACSSFTQVGTSATLSFSDTGLLGSTAYTYRVRATDGTNFSGYSKTNSATTAATRLKAASSLKDTIGSNTQINLSWTAGSEAGGTITSYLVESCIGSACSNFAQIGTTAGTTFSNTGLLAGTTYIYRVRATDGTNFSGYSNTSTATTSTAPPPPITFIQGAFTNPQTPQSSVPVTYTAAQGVGDLNVVIVGWNDSTTTVNTVKDTSGNVYTAALVPTVQTGTASQVIYYAKNIAGAAANANTVTVTFNGSAAYPDIRILEYSGIDAISPLDVTAASSGTGTSSSSGAVTTLNANDLIIGANLVQTGTTGAGAGFTTRFITSPDGDIAEDRVVTATGSYTATAPVSPSGQWIMQLVAFKRHP